MTGPLDVPGVVVAPEFPERTTRHYGDSRPLSKNWALAGKKILGRQWAWYCYEQGYRFTNLVKRVATDFGESQLYCGAFHDNQTVITALAAGQIVVNIETGEPTTILDPAIGKIKLSDGSVVTVPLTTTWTVSRDCGGEQINIPARQIGTATETSLRTESLDPGVYIPVAQHNIAVGWQLFETRKFQPWVSYTSGWSTFESWWTWHQVDGVPTGPWIATGRYVQQAIRAVANMHLLVLKDYAPPTALKLARERQTQFNVKGELAVSDEYGVYWKSWPAKPIQPPADGIGPRPQPIPSGV